MSVSQFNQHRNEFFERCNIVYRQRGNDYNRENDIREYFIYGVVSIFQLIWAKALRLKSLMGFGFYIMPVKDTATFEDTLIDLVNYASFAYAENKCRTMEELPHEKITNSDPIVRDAEPPTSDVERVVLEPRSEAIDSGIAFPPGSDHAFSSLHEACPPCREYAKRSRADNRRDNVDVGHQSDTAKYAGATSQDQARCILCGRASHH